MGGPLDAVDVDLAHHLPQGAELPQPGATASVTRAMVVSTPASVVKRPMEKRIELCAMPVAAPQRPRYRRAPGWPRCRRSRTITGQRLDAHQQGFTLDVVEADVEVVGHAGIHVAVEVGTSSIADRLAHRRSRSQRMRSFSVAMP